mmetsp:Transcript_27938/g.60824  ORF Transcript_27938/g.60824 Transcript_27938/m.60824 type:complete len:105 (-) Transcript_27938:59-373(-)
MVAYRLWAGLSAGSCPSTMLASMAGAGIADAKKIAAAAAHVAAAVPIRGSACCWFLLRWMFCSIGLHSSLWKFCGRPSVHGVAIGSSMSASIIIGRLAEQSIAF